MKLWIAPLFSHRNIYIPNMARYMAYSIARDNICTVILPWANYIEQFRSAASVGKWLGRKCMHIANRMFNIQRTDSWLVCVWVCHTHGKYQCEHTFASNRHIQCVLFSFVYTSFWDERCLMLGIHGAYFSEVWHNTEHEEWKNQQQEVEGRGRWVE